MLAAGLLTRFCLLMSQPARSAGSAPEARQLFNSLASFTSIVPDELTQHVLQQKGVQCSDVRLLRLVSLATQKFITDVASDALQLQKRRRQATAYRQKELGYNRKDTRLLLTTDDLADALREYGVNVKRAPYHAERLTN